MRAGGAPRPRGGVAALGPHRDAGVAPGEREEFAAGGGESRTALFARADDEKAGSSHGGGGIPDGFETQTLGRPGTSGGARWDHAAAQGVPDQDAPGGEEAGGVDEGRPDARGFVPSLVGGIDEDETPALGRWQKSPQGLEGVAPVHLHRAARGDGEGEAGSDGRVDEDQTVRGPREQGRESRRSRGTLGRIPRPGERAEKNREGGKKRVLDLVLAGQEAHDPPVGFAVFPQTEVVPALAGVRVEEAPGGVPFVQAPKERHEREVLDEIVRRAGVVTVTVVDHTGPA